MRSLTTRRRVIIAAVVAIMAVPAVAVANHFTDVDPNDTHAPGINYMEATGITTGCTATRYCPGDNLTRAQMGTFIHRASGNAPGIDPSVNAATVEGAGIGQLVTGAVHVTRDAGDAPVVSRSLNNVSEATASISGSGGSYIVNPGFNATGSFISCTIDSNFVDTRDGTCTVFALPNGNIRVRTYDTGTQAFAPAEFHLLIVGMG
ncbi:S-layer homology domain-containing protein [Nitriliruptor alkaliphilus]|uniref:S-layer homology domain-containing protein n=1 Tax=Nitriliruptor alkaliphilus TaxID=427918 RepID=UPI000697B6BF|nr:S-layer homology domain-containing protein [Nitriliruptor alkaliphilus]